MQQASSPNWLVAGDSLLNLFFVIDDLEAVETWDLRLDYRESNAHSLETRMCSWLLVVNVEILNRDSSDHRNLAI